MLACDDILLPVAVHIAEGDEIYFGGKQPVIIGVREGVYGIAVRDKGIFHTGTPVFRDFAGGELYIFVTAQADSGEGLGLYDFCVCAALLAFQRGFGAVGG